MNDLALLCLKEGKMGKAERWLRRAIQADPYFWEARYNLGLPLAKTGRKEAAIRE